MAEGGQRVALVSGASRGIGAEIARELAAEHGFRVFAGARDPGDVESGERIEPPTGWAGPRGRAGLIERPPVQPLGHLEWLDAQGAVIGPKQP